MVSNSLKISQEEVVKALDRLRREKDDNPEYQKLRKDLPKSWPV
jgi:chromosome segregation ATPase